MLASDAFRNFYEANKEWLQPYAVFSYLRDAYKTPNFREWPKYATYDAKEIETLCRPDSADYPHIAIYYYIQFNLHLQLLAATEHARANGVVLKGDIPIGISRNSVEAWKEPHYFNLNGQAGAPPDDFSVNGQNWGLPTYNWDVMEKDGYAWWMKRFHKMAEYFDAYRIDHILGFFRIWEIPMHAVHGLLGQFVPALPMTREEIESYGLAFREDFFLKPYIHEYFLGQIFGPHTDYVKQTFIEPTDTWEVYRMRPEFDTQRKVEAYFAGKTDDDSIWIRDGLYALISDVLFVPDRNNPHEYHPRIGVQHDYIYRALNDWEKAAFNRLYDQYYYHRHNDFWGQQAMKKLPQLTQSTRMLVCGEDLGMIPDCVAWVMNDLRILPWRYNVCRKTRNKNSATLTGIRTVRSAPSPRTTCLPCAAGGKKTSNRRSVTTTPCSGTTVPHRQRPRRSSAKKWFAITSIATPSSASSPCKTGCPWTANGATRTCRKNASIFLPTRGTTGAGACT